MGLIVIVCMGFFFAVTAIVVLAYIFVIHTTFTKSNIKLCGKMIIILFSSILTVYLFSVLYDFYSNNTEMIVLRGYLGLAPKFSESLKINKDDYCLIYKRNTDYNTGSRGGLNIYDNLILVHDENKKEIEIFISKNIYTAYLDKSRHVDLKNEYGKEKYYINLFVDPKKFTTKEFELIEKMLVNNSERFEQVFDHSYSLTSKPRYHFLSKIYFLNRASLKRRFVCKNDVIIHLIENGNMFAFSSSKESLFYTNIGNPESILARPNKIGKAINKDVILSSSAKFKNITIINGLHGTELRFQGTTIEKCFDEAGQNLFEEFNFTKQAK